MSIFRHVLLLPKSHPFHSNLDHVVSSFMSDLLITKFQVSVRNKSLVPCDSKGFDLLYANQIMSNPSATGEYF